MADGRPRAAYDPARDLAVLLHEALRQGHWGPAALGALRRLEEHLAPAGEFALASDIEARLREMLARASRRQAALDNVAYLAAMPPQLLRETLLAWQYEHPDRAQRLREMLAGPERSRADLDEEAAAAATRLHEAAAEFRAEMAGAEPDLDGFVERTLAAAAEDLPDPVRRILARRPDDPSGPAAGYSGAI